MQHAQVVTFPNSKQETFKKINLIVSKICVCQKRDNIFSLFIFLTFRKTLRSITLRTTILLYLYQLLKMPRYSTSLLG